MKTPKRSDRRTRLGLALLAWGGISRLLAAQESPPPEAAAAPVERADELLSKATVAVYILSDDTNVDVNVRHKFGDVVAWVGGFIDPKGTSVGRIGAEYDFQRGGLLVVPTVQVGTNGFVAGQLYTEIGTKVYAIAGYSQTNLKPLLNLTFDPNESAQVGAGTHLTSYDRLYGFVTWDVRLGTRQQDTHVLWRHRLDEKNGLTIDVLYKSGLIDEDTYVKGMGIGLYWDRPTWFLKAYYDPYVNFTDQTMVRVGGGLKF